MTPTVTPSEPTAGVTWYRVGTCCDADSPPVSDLGVSGGTVNTGDGLLYNSVSILLAAGGVVGSDVIDASQLIANYCDTITCPSLTPTATVTPTQTPPNLSLSPTPTVTVTPTVTPSLSYSRFSLNECCDNHYPGTVTLPEANILDSLGVGPGDIVALDGICYTINLAIPGTSSNTPSTQVSHVDCETCLSSVPALNRCAHTYVACFEDSYGAGDLMAAPVRVNTTLTTNNPVGTAEEFLKFEYQVINSDGTAVPFRDCYRHDSTYDDSHGFDTWVDQHQACCVGQKCEGAYVILRTCDTYNGSVSSLDGEQLS